MFRTDTPCTNLFHLLSFTLFARDPAYSHKVVIPPAALLRFATLRFRYGHAEEICDSIRRKVSTCHANIQVYGLRRDRRLDSYSRSCWRVDDRSIDRKRCRRGTCIRCSCPIWLRPHRRRTRWYRRAGLARRFARWMVRPARMVRRSPRDPPELALTMGRWLVWGMVPALLGRRCVG